jgi:hypothetical protein
MEFGLRLFEPSEGCGFQGHQEIECLGGVGSLGDLDGNGVASNPFTWVLLVIILGDPDRFKVLGEDFLVMLEVKTGKQLLSSSSWYLSGRSLLLASMMRCTLRSSLIFCLRSIVGAS